MCDCVCVCVFFWRLGADGSAEWVSRENFLAFSKLGRKWKLSMEKVDKAKMGSITVYELYKVQCTTMYLVYTKYIETI